MLNSSPHKLDTLSSVSDSLPLVSIVIPSYNHARYLSDAIDSILAQDYPHIELIVIDDGSTDGSKDILAQYTGRIHWEAQPNQGQVATLNRGWVMSRGEILGYLSADDLLLPGAVAEEVHCLRGNPDAVLAYCDFNLIDPNSAVVRRVSTPEFDYREMVTRFVCAPGPGALFRRAAFEKAGLWDPNFHQMLDYEYWLRLGRVGKFVHVPRVLAAYRVHPGSQTFAATHQIRPEEPVRIIEHYFSSDNLPEDIRLHRNTAFSNAYLRSAQLHFRIGNIRAGLLAVRMSFQHHPSNVLSIAALRILINALFNRLGHRVFWTLRRFFRAVGLTRSQSAPQKKT
jgi:glycosyltransferase involved in cell wall biosynthesis